MTKRPLASPKQLAEFLGRPEGTLKQWRYHGRGPAYIKTGGHVRYDWDVVEAWLAQQGRGDGGGGPVAA